MATTIATNERTTRRIVAVASLASAVLGAIGVAFLVSMFSAFAVGARTTGLVLGRINDVLVLVSYVLAVPAVLGMHVVLRRHSPGLTTIATLTSIAAIGAIGVLQALLILDVLTFEQQIGPVSIALLAFGVGIVLAGYVGRSSGLMPDGVRMGLLGATYVGFPVWAWWAGRRLAGLSEGARGR